MKPAKNFFTFDSFDKLSTGDTFKFSPVIDNDIPSRFYNVYYKDAKITKINSTYGKSVLRLEFPNNLTREIMLFPNRKK